MSFIFEKVNTLTKRLGSLREQPAGGVGTVEYVPCGYKTSNDAPAEGWQIFEPGQRISGKDTHFWFRMAFRTPEAEEGHTLYLRVITGREGNWDATNPQGLVFLNGRMTQALDTNHTMVRLEPGAEVRIQIYFYVGMIDVPVEFLPSLVWVDDRIEGIWYDFSVALDAVTCQGRECENSRKILGHLEQAANRLVMWPLFGEAFYAGIEAAGQYLAEHLYGTGDPDGPVTYCIGHTHIDVAWLWTLAQTCEKSQRSFATVLELMRRYPEYKFMSSQCQLYKYVKQEAPELYEEIRERVKEGRWEVEGAMWLEADNNLISGESMVRQMVHGKRFMKEEFGVDSRVLWLPDVFGYSAATPQIMKKCGVDYFYTSKISWNETNRLPYDTFYWQGIDGTEVLTNFVTAQDRWPDGTIQTFTTYNADVTPAMVRGSWDRYQQKDYNNSSLITFGFGDGGGGPTREMLERQRRLHKGLPGIPRTEIGFAGDWIRSVEKNLQEGIDRTGRVPRWVGELYLEFHRGTYTSIAKNKRNNRKSELSLQKAEGLSETARRLLGREYPAAALWDTWETVLKNQFHDILPGSSIFEVYEDCDREYAKVLSDTATLSDGALAALAGAVSTEGGLLVYNPLGVRRNASVKWNGVTVETGELPPMGWKVLHTPVIESTVTALPELLENLHYRITLDAAGRITSLWDKDARREVLLPGSRGNELQLFEDYPKEYDAWEITDYYKQKMWVLDEPAEITPVFDGARAGLKIVHRYLSSFITQTMRLYDTIRRIDFETEIDWQEEHMLLKAAFPLDVHASKATYEIQFGSLERPTHSNTSWDAAKFEVCAHKWADISDNGYGASLLNDCKYGHNAEGSTLKLTLLKCATNPNPNADKGHHVFTYALLPHEGDWRQAGTVAEAYSLNQPAVAVELPKQEGSLPETWSFVRCDAPNAVVDTVKRADDGSGTVLRLYDAWDRRGNVTLRFGFTPSRAVLCDMLENELEDLPLEGSSLTVPLKNFEILTLKIQ